MTLGQTTPSGHPLQMGLEAGQDEDGMQEPAPYLAPVETETKQPVPATTSVRKHTPLKRVAGENPRTAISSHHPHPSSRPHSMLSSDPPSGSDLLRVMQQRVRRFDSQNSQTSDSSSDTGRSVTSNRSPWSSGRKHRSGSEGQMQPVSRGMSGVPPPVPPRHIPPSRGRTSPAKMGFEGFHSRALLRPQDTTQSMDPALLSQALAHASPQNSVGLLDELAERVAVKMGVGMGAMPDMAPVQVTQLRHHVHPPH